MAAVVAPVDDRSRFAPVTEAVMISLTGEIMIHGDTPEQVRQVREALSKLPKKDIIKALDLDWVDLTVHSYRTVTPSLRIRKGDIDARYYVAE